MFFSNTSQTLNEILNKAQESVHSLQREVAFQIRDSLTHGAQNKVLDLNIVVEAPNLIMPSSFADPNCPRLVAVLGTLELHSNLEGLKQSVVRGPDGKKHVSIEYFYQQSFNVSASRIRLLLAHDENWRDYVERVPKCSLVEDLSFGMELGVLTFPTKMLPKVKLSAGLLSALKGNMSPSDLADVLRIVDAMLPRSAPAAPDKTEKTLAGAAAVAASMPRLDVPSSPAKADDANDSNLSFFEASSFLQLDEPDDEAHEGGDGAADDTLRAPELMDEFVFDQSLLHLSDNPTAIDIVFNAGKVELSLYKRVSPLVCKDLVLLHLGRLEVSMLQRRHDLKGEYYGEISFAHPKKHKIVFVR